MLVPNSDRDWTEDFSQENGNYANDCIVCAQEFIGYKRRSICKLCSTKVKTNYIPKMASELLVERADKALGTMDKMIEVLGPKNEREKFKVVLMAMIKDSYVEGYNDARTEFEPV